MPFPTLLYLRPRFFFQKVNGQNPDRNDPDGSLIKKEHVTYLFTIKRHLIDTVGFNLYLLQVHEVTACIGVCFHR